MGGEGNRPEGRAQDRREGQEPDGHGAAPAGHTRAGACWWASPAVPPLPEAFTTALRRRVAQRALLRPPHHPARGVHEEAGAGAVRM